VTLRNATLADLDRIEAWDKKEHMQASIGDYEFNDWNWKQELPRNPSWRFQLIAEAGDGVPIGFVQIIDALEEETHYWGLDCEPNLRAIDIWIGEEDCLLGKRSRYTNDGNSTARLLLFGGDGRGCDY
jgi:aminoglycoside 6'-N-acetyltransferase